MKLKRYKVKAYDKDGHLKLWAGEWCHIEDVERLEAENDALHAECDRLTAMLVAQASTPNGPESCEWLYCEEEDAWDTGCGHKFQIIEGSPKDNGLIYCPYCGKPIKECGE